MIPGILDKQLHSFLGDGSFVDFCVFSCKTQIAISLSQGCWWELKGEKMCKMLKNNAWSPRIWWMFTLYRNRHLGSNQYLTTHRFPPWILCEQFHRPHLRKWGVLLERCFKCGECDLESYGLHELPGPSAFTSCTDTAFIQIIFIEKIVYSKVYDCLWMQNPPHKLN